MLYRKSFTLFSDDEKTGGLIPPTNQPNAGQKPEASGEEMPDFVKEPDKAWKEIQKLRKESAGYRDQRNGSREEFAAIMNLLDGRLPKQENAPDADPVKGLEARIAAFEAQQKEALSAAAKEKHEALRLKVAAEIFGDKVGGDNKAEVLAILAARLNGADEASLREDAKALAALMPNPQWKNQTTNASPSGNPVTETHEQRIRRLRSGGDAKTSFG
jgi:hypothetical protein